MKVLAEGQAPSLAPDVPLGGNAPALPRRSGPPQGAGPLTPRRATCRLCVGPAEPRVRLLQLAPGGVNLLLPLPGEPTLVLFLKPVQVLDEGVDVVQPLQHCHVFGAV